MADDDFLPKYEGVDSNEEITHRAINRNTRALSDLEKSIKRLGNETEKASKSLFGINFKLAGVIGLATTIALKSNEIQRSALAIGTDSVRVLEDNNRLLADLPGGSFIPMVERIKQLELGFKDNNRGLMLTATRMKISGQSTDGLVKMMAAAMFQGRVSQEGIGNLAVTLEDTARRNFMSMGTLTQSIDGLTSEMATLGALGASEPVIKAVGDLTAQLGAGSKQQVEQLTKLMLDKSPQALVSRSILGIQRLSNELVNLRGLRDAPRALDILKESIVNVRKNTDGIRKGFGQTGIGPLELGIVEQVVGDQRIFPIGNLMEALDRDHVLNRNISDIEASIEGQVKRLVAPVESLATHSMPLIISNLVGILGALVGIKAVLLLRSGSLLAGAGAGVATGKAAKAIGMTVGRRIMAGAAMLLGPIGLGVTALLLLPDLLGLIGSKQKKTQGILQNIQNSPGITGKIAGRPGQTRVPIPEQRRKIIEEHQRKVNTLIHKMIFTPPTPKEQDNSEMLDLARRQAEALDSISESARQSARNSRGAIKGGAK
jgi:hypothetical protein